MPKAVGGFDCPYADDDFGCGRCFLPLGYTCPASLASREEGDDYDGEDDDYDGDNE